MTDKTMPPLPSGSVDLDALHKADAQGKDLNEAIAEATTRVGPLTEDEFDALPSLSGKTKAGLLKIAEDEGVAADESMTNAAIGDAIVVHRAVTPVLDDTGKPINPPAGDVNDEPSELDGDSEAADGIE